MSILQELYHNNTDVDVPLAAALNESLSSLGKKAAKFFTKNPALTIAAASMAIIAHSKYEQNKRNAIRLFAKSAYEKKMMTDVVHALTNQGKFKINKMFHNKGSQEWILKRI